MLYQPSIYILLRVGAGTLRGWFEIRVTKYPIPPAPGELGHESWSADNELWKYGGGSVWQTPAVDPNLGLIYFSTGNPGPDFNGARISLDANAHHVAGFKVDALDLHENRIVVAVVCPALP